MVEKKIEKFDLEKSHARGEIGLSMFSIAYDSSFSNSIREQLIKGEKVLIYIEPTKNSRGIYEVYIPK